MSEPPVPALRQTHPEGLFVAGRGSGPHDGLHRWRYSADGWRSTHLATVTELSALAKHPSLPVIYGVSGVGQDGWMHAWDVSDLSGDQAHALNMIPSQGAEPCNLAVDPGGRMLVITNYTSSTLAVQKLARDGAFEGELRLIYLTGGSIDPDRQGDAHPHQAVFDGNRLYVVDLGADLLREYDVDPDGAVVDALIPVRETAVPAGTGPRHLVVLPGGRLALSGELGSTVITGRPGIDADAWAVVSSTERTGPAKTRSARNYPGDIQASADGRLIYIANRGYDTIATFAVDGEVPRLICELDSRVAWPQHLLVWGDELLVAGWDSSQVITMPLVDGVPSEPHVLFECAGANWLLPENSDRHQN
jgi:6-phosphogluconolactonase